MPRPRRPALFTLGQYWIRDDEPGRPGLWRYWNDSGSGRIRRARLAATDLEAAKLELAALIVKGTPKSAATFLAIALEKYFVEVTDKLPSKDPARRAGALITEFMLEQRPHKAPRISHFDGDAQKDFAAWCAKRYEHAITTISRNLSVAASAMAHARIDHAVFYDLNDIVAALSEKGAPIIRQKKRFMPNDSELGRFLNFAEGRLFRACIIMLGTACRPEAAINLGPAQRNREAGVLELNPDGRTQTKKWRPIVREPQFLTAWLDQWEEEGRNNNQVLVSYVGYASVDSLQSAINRVRITPTEDKDGADLPRMVAYSIRHKMTTVLRRYEVPSDQYNLQLGHKRPSNRISDLYGEYEPGYLAGACSAIDAFAIHLQRLTQRRLFTGAKPTADNVTSIQEHAK